MLGVSWFLFYIFFYIGEEGKIIYFKYKVCKLFCKVFIILILLFLISYKIVVSMCNIDCLDSI